MIRVKEILFAFFHTNDIKTWGELFFSRQLTEESFTPLINNQKSDNNNEQQQQQQLEEQTMKQATSQQQQGHRRSSRQQQQQQHSRKRKVSHTHKQIERNLYKQEVVLYTAHVLYEFQKREKKHFAKN